MSAVSPDQLIDDEMRRKNIRLGLILGCLVAATIAGFMTMFTLKGLPKDPEIVARMKQEESARQAADGLGEGDKAATVTSEPDSAGH